MAKLCVGVYVSAKYTQLQLSPDESNDEWWEQ